MKGDTNIMTNDVKVLQKALQLANKLWSICDIAENGNCDYKIEERYDHCVECITMRAEKEINK